MRHAAIDAVIEKLIIPFVGIFIVLPGLYVWEAYARRVNARRGRR